MRDSDNMSGKSILLKEEGNRHFVKGDYAGAEGLYSKAIIADASNPALYTNRAMARLKLKMWDSVITDCKTCLERSPDNMKALYYLSQAELAQKQYDAALEHGKRAYELCLKTNDRSLSAITAQVLQCKKERWEHLEDRRLGEERQLEREVIALLEKERDEELKGAEDEGERGDIASDWEQKLASMRTTFEKSRSAAEKRREVPDWAIDDITFGIMLDPVITKTGKSYERSAILEHLKRSHTDPLTREELFPSDLRPNLALKQACAEFLDENGWAVDW